MPEDADKRPEWLRTVSRFAIVCIAAFAGAALGAWTFLAAIGLTPWIVGVETTTYKVRAKLLKYAISSACGPPSTHLHDLEGTATIAGVGFFDVKQPTPQTGLAPNGIVIHPVLDFTDAVCSKP